MINFFRKIRRKLADNNQFLKYSRYAIGEILLVVIGILIALQINIKNEERKTKGVVQNYYSQLLKDLKKDSAYLEDAIIKLEHSIKIYNDYIEAIKEEDIDSAELLNSIMSLQTHTRYYIFNSNTIETLQSTGDIKLLPPQIRNMLIDLKRIQVNQIAITRGNNNDFQRKQLDAMSLGNSDLYGLKIMKKPIEQNYSAIILNLHAAHIIKNFTEKNLWKPLK